VGVSSRLLLDDLVASFLRSFSVASESLTSSTLFLNSVFSFSSAIVFLYSYSWNDTTCTTGRRGRPMALRSRQARRTPSC